MKIFAYSRPRERSLICEESIRRFKRIADECGMEYSLNRTYADQIYDALGIKFPSYDEVTAKDLEGDATMMSLGGDGTFLETIRSLKGLPMPVIGVNTGRLGFLAAVSPEDLPFALECIKNHRYSIEKRPQLEVVGDFGTEVEFPCAMNEFTIHRHTASMVEVTVRADEQLIAVARGDGVIIATPTGSTAYSLSVGGPIVSPECQCVVLSAIAPHNFTIRPVVLPDTSELSLEINSRKKEVAVSLDNQSFVVPDGSRFIVRKGKYSTFLAHLQNISFYDTLRNKIMWGMDKRDSAV